MALRQKRPGLPKPLTPRSRALLWAVVLICMQDHNGAAAQLTLSGQDLTTPQNTPIWLNLSALAASDGGVSGLLTSRSFSVAGARYTFYVAGIPEASKGEVFLPEPAEFALRTELLQGRQLKASVLPYQVPFPYMVQYVPTAHKFSCSLCEDDGTSCTICVPYTHLRVYIASKTSDVTQVSNTASIGIIVKQNSDAAWTGGGGGALYLDGFDDFALAKMKGVAPGAMTVGLWVKVLSTRPLQTVFSIFTSRGRELEVHDTLNLQVLRGVADKTPKMGISIADGTWHHVAASLDTNSGEAVLFVDATQVATDLFQRKIPLAVEAELILGQRPTCGATSERQRVREQRQLDLLKPYNVTQPDGRVYRVCASEIPKQNCDVFHLQELRDTMVWSLDNDEVLKRGSIPEARMVEPGAWRCAHQDRVCTQGASIMDAFACVCAPGCMQPQFALNGYIDEVRIYSIAKTAQQISFDMRVVIGDQGVGAGIGRAALHWQSLFLYFSFDADGKALDGGSLREVSMLASSTATLFLGGALKRPFPSASDLLRLFWALPCPCPCRWTGRRLSWSRCPFTGMTGR